MKYRILFGLLLCGLATGVMAGSIGQLNKGYYVPAKMPMTVVYPRPDSEVSSGARQKWAFADGTMQYRIPIAIQGGAYPFYVASTSGLPTGMSISSDPNSPDYMKAIWTPAKGDTSTYHCSVVIKDQDANTINVTWTVTAVGDDGSHFIFIDPNASTNGSGTKTSPLNSMKGIAVASDSGKISPYANKIIVLRGGTTYFYGPETSSHPGDYEFIANSIKNPYVFIGYTGETAELDMSSGVFRNYGQPDVYFGQLLMKNAKQGFTPDGTEYDTTMYFDWSAQASRITFFENQFQNLQWYSGSGYSSNQAAILSWNPGSFRNYWAIIGNTMNNYNISMVDLFNIKYGVLENNQFLSGTSFPQNGGFNIKADDQNISIRKNSSLTGVSMYNGFVRIVGQASIGNDNIEVCYNVAIMPINSHSLYSYLTTGASETPHIYVYRNTLYGDVSHFDLPGTYVQENNVIISNNNRYGILCESGPKTCTTLNVISPNIVQGSLNGNLYGTSSDGLIDQNGALIGNASKYLGKLGYQVSNGTPLLNAPTWQ